MDGIIKFIPFLKTYPTWMQLYFLVLVVATVVFVVLLVVFWKPSLPKIEAMPEKTSVQETTIKDSPGSSIYQAGRDIIVKTPVSSEKRSEQKKIQTLVLEVRLTCELKEGSELPPDKVDFLPIGESSHAYFEGPGGKVRLAFQSPVVFRRVDVGRVTVINRFILEPGSELFNRPTEVLQNYTKLLVPIVTVVWGKSLKTMRLLELSIFINNDDPIYSSYQYDTAFQEGPQFTVPLWQLSKK